MAAPVAALIILCIALAVVVAWLFAHRRRPAALEARLVPVIAAARRRALVAVLCAVSVFVAGAVAGIAFPELLGQPFAFAPLAAGAAGILLYAATPPRDASVQEGAARVAVLEPRSWRTVAPRRWLWGIVEIAVMFVVLVVFGGVTADADEQGRQRVIRFEAAGTVSSAGPYPGWSFGVPALIGLAVLLVATLVAMQRIGTTTAFPHPQDADADLQWRTASASVILTLAMGAMLFALGGLTLAAGLAMRNAVIEGATPVVWSVIADTLWFGGVLFLVLSVVGVTLAALTAFTIGERLDRRVAAEVRR